MTDKQAIEQITAQSWINQPPSLHRITELLEKLGNPQQQLKFIHVAGSNGKGSTASMLSSVLLKSGYHVGLFTSPHLFQYQERIMLGGEPIDKLGDYAQIVLQIAETMEDKPTEFELILAIAMLYYRDEGAEIVVLEVGLGGTLDATNVITTPEVAVITNIGLEHTQLLGNTLAEIATEKAGIIKQDCPVVLYHQSSEVVEVVQNQCKQKGATLTVTDPTQYRQTFVTKHLQSFLYRDTEYSLRLLGEHQCFNGLVVIEAVKQLRAKGWDIPTIAIHNGLGAASWAGRFERLSESPDFIVDGGHNPQCSTCIADTLEGIYPDQKIIFIVGMMGDKEYGETMSHVAHLAKEFITIPLESPRALQPQAFATYLTEKFGIKSTPCASLGEGIAYAQAQADEQDVICAFGSLYLVGEVRDYFDKSL